MLGPRPDELPMLHTSLPTAMARPVAEPRAAAAARPARPAAAGGPPAELAWLPGSDCAAAPAWAAPAPPLPASAARAAVRGSAIVWWLLEAEGLPGRDEKEILGVNNS